MMSDKWQAQPTADPGKGAEDASEPEVEGQLWRVGEAVGGALGRIDSLVHDSRPGLGSPEQSLASYGVTWAADPFHDRALADEVQAARRQRLLGEQERIFGVHNRPPSVAAIRLVDLTRS